MPVKRYTNFGHNLNFQPAQVFTPRTEEELLAILSKCRGQKIRTVGRLHSWSEAPTTDGVLLDPRYFNQVQVELREGKHWVTAGAGCQIKQVLAELDRQDAGTLPTLGLVTEQSIAGAISTATHGSGKSSMSHYVEEVRIATYDPATGEPIIRAINSGPELQAARCSLGALGVVVSVSFWARPQYLVEEHFKQYETLDEVLAAENDYPLQQFFLLPWKWQFFAQHRRETVATRRGWPRLYRWYFFLTFDISLHLFVILLVRVLRSPRAVRFFFRHVTPRTVVKNWTVIDQSQEMLVMEHELFRHIEIEMFVTRRHLPQALDFIVALLKHCDGDRAAIDSATRERLEPLGLLEKLNQLCGNYTHHYPICIRRVLPDETLISMTSGAEEPSYAVSFISYARSSERHGFFAFAEILAQSMAALSDGRPHWGKVCPLSPQEVARLYPAMPEFRAVCQQFDPHTVFSNDWVARLFELQTI